MTDLAAAVAMTPAYPWPCSPTPTSSPSPSSGQPSPQLFNESITTARSTP